MAHEATFVVSAGDEVPFVMAWRPSHLPAPEAVDAAEALASTTAFWDGWVSRCSYEGEYRDAVIRSLITLKALTYAPTGGIVAAPTTSLPEDIGGVRNWDYRYCWLRDATITLEALLRTGYTQEAADWREWLGRAIAGDPSDVQIMYGVAGERRLPEWEADWLAGLRGLGAGPDRQRRRVPAPAGRVRRGHRRAGARPARRACGSTGIPGRCCGALLLFLEKHWHEPDEGIWEVRGPRRHFVHSKVMAWVAFDRAVRLTELGQPGPTERWRDAGTGSTARSARRATTRSAARSPSTTAATELDASVLLIPEVGFLPASDPRVVSTVRTIQRELVKDGLVLRYSLPETPADPAGVVDGLTGAEGAFLACSFWLVNALHMIGEYDEAVELFDRLLAVRNDVGLLSEEYDPRYDRQVGNTPQAFSHMPLILSALNLSGARR